MKFSLILLLGLCAFASSSDIFQDIPDVEYITLEPIIVPRNGDSFPVVINEYLAKVTDEFNSIVKRFKDLSGSTRNEVENYNTDQIAQVNEQAVVLRQDIQELARKGASYAACGNQHIAEITDLTASAAFGIKECAGDVALALKALADDIVTASTALVTDSLRLKEIVLECYGSQSKLGAAKCVLQHFKEFKDLATSVISKAKESLANFKVHGQQLVDSVKKCNEQYVQTTFIKFKNLKNIIVECAK